MQSVTNPTAVVLVTEPPGIQDYVTPVAVVAPPPRVCCTQRVIGVLIALGGVAIGVAGGVTFGVFYRTC